MTGSSPSTRFDDLLTLPAVARQLGIAEATAYQLARSGELPAVRNGRQVRIRPEDVDLYIRKCRPPKERPRLEVSDTTAPALILAGAGAVPEVVRAAALLTCRQCPFRSAPIPDICAECPAVVMVRAIAVSGPG